MAKNKKLEGKIALITGASRGLGAALAKRFALEGAHVILTARTIGGLEEVDDAIQASDGSATLVPFDITDYNKIDELGGIIANRFGHLDILVGNAGELGQLGPIVHTDPKVFEKVMAVNVTANYRLIRSFDSLLKAAKNGRAVFVSSDAAAGDYAYWGAYSASKAALEKMIKIYAEELEQTNVKVNLVDPGTMATEMIKKAYPGIPLEQWISPDQVTDIFVKLCQDTEDSNGMVFKAAVNGV